MRFYSLVAAGLTAGGLCVCAPVQSWADNPYQMRDVQIDVGAMHIDPATGAVWYDPWPYAYPYNANPDANSITLTFRVGDIYYQYEYNPRAWDAPYRSDPRYRPYYNTYRGGYRR